MRSFDFDAALALFRRLGAQPDVSITLPPPLLVEVVVLCQIALRHPENTGPTCDAVRQWIHEMSRMLEAIVPGTQQLIEAGNAPPADGG